MLSPDAPFRKYKTTEREAFFAGLNTGHAWDRWWRPGGPYVSSGDYNDPDWRDYCARTKVNHEAYLRGFDIGFLTLVRCEELASHYRAIDIHLTPQQVMVEMGWDKIDFVVASSEDAVRCKTALDFLRKREELHQRAVTPA